MVADKSAEKAKTAFVKLARGNERNIISGKKIIEHARSQHSMTKKQAENIKKRTLVRRALPKTPTRFPRGYTTQQSKRKLKLRKVQCYKNHERKIRASITPGAILILLAGRHKGKRVVFLKSLPSGMLLVTGPFKYNGVPLRRVNQRYVIATQTRVKLSSVPVPSELTDTFFRRQDLKTKRSADKIFAEEEKKYAVSDDRKKFQKQVDSALITAIKRTKYGSVMTSYLKSMFSLSKKDYPHKMVF